MRVALSCLSGGTLHVCPRASRSTFIGCCASDDDPCGNGCAKRDVRPATFNPKYFAQFVDASCGGGAKFYTCTSYLTAGTFWGCCTVSADPCAGDKKGCGDDLRGAFLEAYNDRQWEDYWTGAESATSSSAATLSTSTITTTTTNSASNFPSSTTPASVTDPLTLSTPFTTSTPATLTPTQTTTTYSTSAPPTATQTHAAHPPIAAIAGGVTGGSIALALVIGLLVYIFRFAKRSRAAHHDARHRSSDQSLDRWRDGRWHDFGSVRGW